MQIEETALPGVVIITPKRFGDDRGYFSETYNLKALSELGISTPFVQDNQSLSRQVGTIRGLHFQRPPHAQAKLSVCSRAGSLTLRWTPARVRRITGSGWGWSFRPRMVVSC